MLLSLLVVSAWSGVADGRLDVGLRPFPRPGVGRPNVGEVSDDRTSRLREMGPQDAPVRIGNPVEGANVSGEFSGGINQSFSGITDSSGTAWIIPGWTNADISNLTFTVNNVTHPTLTYAPEDNLKTSDNL